MSNDDTKADFALAAATPPPSDDSEDPPEEPSPTPPSTRPAFPAVTNVWRGLFTLSRGFTLCAIAVAESTGSAKAPAWFLGFAIPVLTEWVGEWVVYGRRKGAG